MKNFLTILKLLEIKLKTAGTIGYLIYLIIGLTVMFAIWTPIFQFIGWLISPFTTPILDIKNFGSLSIFGLIGYSLLILLILAALTGIIACIFDIFKSIYKKEKINFKIKEFILGVGSILFVIFLAKYFENGQIRNIIIGLLLLGGLGNILIAFDNKKILEENDNS